ncbi:TlpA family protein disulfide reductase [Sphingobacterium kyonggiense]
MKMLSCKYYFFKLVRNGFKSCLLLIIFNFIVLYTFGQTADNSAPILRKIEVGDYPPPIKVKEWIKGSNIEKFEKGQIYVLEFWATWCKPCIRAMPHLSELASKYKDKVTFVGISIYELEKTSVQEIKTFVDEMGDKMSYNVAIDSNGFMARNWMDGTGSDGIPKTFLIDSNGKLAWIGQPMNLENVLEQVINKQWDLEKEKLKVRERNYKDSIGTVFSYTILDYEYINIPDSAIVEINRRIKKEPKLQYTYFPTIYTFQELLNIDQKKAVAYGKEILSLDIDPKYDIIIESILNNETIHFIPEIYLLGAEAYELFMAEAIKGEYPDLSIYYARMADWYFKGGDQQMAILTHKKAIESMIKDQAKELEELQKKLLEYQKGKTDK